MTRGTAYALSDIQFDEFVRLRLNEALAERGEKHRSSVQSWGSLRHVGEAMFKARLVLREARRKQRNDEVGNPGGRKA